MDGEKYDWDVHPRADGLRLDQFLAKRMPDLSRSYVQKLIDEGHATIDGEICRRSQRVRTDDQVELVVPPPVTMDLVPEDIPLEFAYEDEDLLVVNKPAGMVVHPNSNDRSGTLVHALLHHCTNLSGINGVERPGIVHRIDKDTTGLLLVAKNDVAHRHLSDQFRDHSTERLYVALVWGGSPAPDEGTITTRINRDPRDRKRMASVPDGGKVAVTHYQVVEEYGPVSMVQCALDTGRTHQIRVHLSEMGHPLVGDPTYGGLQKRWLAIPPSLGKVLSPIRGQMLHAATLGFIHPRTDAYMKFQTPPHALMTEAIATLRGYADLDVDAEGPWDRPDAPSFGRTDALTPELRDPDWV